MMFPEKLFPHPKADERRLNGGRERLAKPRGRIVRPLQHHDCQTSASQGQRGGRPRWPAACHQDIKTFPQRCWQSYGVLSVSTYLEPFLTTNPKRCHFATISARLLTRSRTQGTCGPPASGNTSSGR